jgi:predicted XRE-type DNA-binding protein
MQTSVSYIYVLRCPITLKVRYVGKANDPHYRFKCHLWAESRNKDKKKLYSWFNDLKAQGQIPILETVCCYKAVEIGKKESLFYELYNNGNLLNEKNLEDEHKRIDVVILKNILKTKKIKISHIAKVIGLHQSNISNYLLGKSTELSYKRAYQLSEYIKSLQ